MMFMMPTPPTMSEMLAMTVSMPEIIESREPVGCKLLLSLMTVKLLLSFLALLSEVLICSVTVATASVVSVRTVIC